MWYAILPVLGFAVGGVLAFALMYPAMRRAKEDQARFQRLRRELDEEWDQYEAKREKALQDSRRLEKRIEEYNHALYALRTEEQTHARQVAAFRTHQQEWRKNSQAESERVATAQRREKEEWQEKVRVQQQDWMRNAQTEYERVLTAAQEERLVWEGRLRTQEAEFKLKMLTEEERASTALRREKDHWENVLRTRQEQLTTREQQLDDRIIAYDQLVEENQFLTTQVKDLTLHAAFLEHLRQTDRAGHTSMADQRDQLGRAYFDEVLATARKAMTANNRALQNQRVRTVAEQVRAAGVALTPAEEEAALDALRVQFEKVLRTQEEREYEAEIREQIREEERQKREIEAADAEVRRTELEKAAVEAEIARVRAEAAHQAAEAIGRENEELAARNAATIATLQSKLAEVDANNLRAVSNAQLTRKGCVYVISNIGSFGEGVFKIGMSRRHDPTERIRELSGASVPFPFDVHMQIECDDAPTLESTLHREFDGRRLNRVNKRKEFFRVPLDEIVSAVKQYHGSVECVTEAEAAHFRESLLMGSNVDLDIFSLDDEPPTRNPEEE